MTAWILIAYLYAAYTGGPITTRFDDRAACEGALEQMKVSFRKTFDQGICVPASSAKVPE